MLKITSSRFCEACRSFRKFRTLLSSRAYAVSADPRAADHLEEQDDKEGESGPGEHTWEDFDDSLPEGSTYDHVYPGHIPSTLFQKSLLSVGTAFVAITAPWRGDSIATLGETTGYVALKYTRQKMLQDPVGRQILEERPRINSKTIDLERLKTLPECTFGKVYSDWLEENHCHPDQRLPVHFVDDPDLAYVMTRYREIHDLVHALLGMPTHMLGEVTIKWIEGLQTGLPMCLSGGLFGALRLRPKQRKAYRESHLAYAFRCGLKGKLLMNLYFENNWETPVEELRAQFNLELPPPTPAKIWSN